MTADAEDLVSDDGRVFATATPSWMRVGEAIYVEKADKGPRRRGASRELASKELLDLRTEQPILRISGRTNPAG